MTTDSTQRVAWTAGEWLNRPPAHRTDEADGSLLVTAAGGSDFWRTTSYGFVRDTGHALLVPFAPDSAVEVTFRADLPELYDQAGVLVRVAPGTWLKAGGETSDGVPHLGAVVTHGPPRGLPDLSPSPPSPQGGGARTSRSGSA
ncbi:DUF1349 domain-containing protein, partial [Streptomyces sp. SPB074]|uniref:DUF1349 domain-containing protein n=1 Tax=Streptomyces sp. (strain SPB074) TaxID=465543 RepID=UPI00056A55ED